MTEINYALQVAELLYQLAYKLELLSLEERRKLISDAMDHISRGKLEVLNDVFHLYAEYGIPNYQPVVA
jgi:hypothetical protein